MPGYVDGGYVYEPPLSEAIPDRILSDAQTQAEIRTFKTQLEPLVWPWAPDKWKPYFENEYLGSKSRVALEGLRDAIAYLTNRNNAALPVTILRKRTGKSPLALVGSLSQKRGLESWQRKNERGVTMHAIVLFLAKHTHDVVLGDPAGVRDVDSTPQPSEVPLSIDEFNYLPHIDGTTNYTVRHAAIDTVAIGSAVRPLLRAQGMQHTWEFYLSSAHSQV